MRSVVLAAWVLLCSTVAHAADDPAVTLRRFFGSYAEAEALDSYWTEAARGRERFERAARLTHRSRCLVIEGIDVHDVVVNADRATARVAILLTKRERSTGHVWGPRPVDYTVSLVRTGVDWRIDELVPTVERLADLLVAGAPERRRELFAAAPELMSADLDRLLIGKAIAATNVPDLPAAARIAGIVDEIAGQIGDRGGQSLQRSILSIIARMEGRMTEARALATEARTMAREVDEPDVLARALISLGRSYDNDPPGETRPRIFREAAALEDRVEDLSLMVRAAVSLEADAWRNDDYVALRRYLDQQLRLAEFAGDTTGIANAIHNLANIYSQLSDPASCVEYARRAAELFADISPGETWIAAILTEGRCLHQNGDAKTARVMIERGLAAAREWKNEKQHAWALMELAYLNLELQEYEAAERLARQGLALERPHRVSTTYLILAQALLAQRRFADALETINAYRTEDPVMAAGPSREFWASVYESRAHRGLGDTAAALDDLRIALDANERLRQQYPGDEGQRAAAVSGISDVYAEAIDLQVEIGQVEEALVLAERAKSGVLLDTLRHGYARPAKSMTADEQEVERRLESEIGTLNRQLAASGADDREAVMIRERLERVRVDHGSLQAALYARHPRLRTERGRVTVASIKTMVDALPDRGAFLEYAIGEERSHAFIVTRAADGRALVRVQSLPIGRRALEDRVIAYRAQIAARGLAARRQARELDAILLSPLEDALATTRVLGIVPDSILWQLPFESLVDSRDRYRLERHTIFYAPSVSVLLEMQKGGSRRNRGTVFAVGDPLVAAPVRSNLSAVYRGTDLSSLPDARLEVEKLRSIYGGEAAVFVGAAATEPRVRAEIGKYDVLHFATHGILDDAAPMYSRLLLAEGADPTSAGGDGLLETWELMKLDISADLVVMSSCDSARGRVTAGEGIIGMTWAAFVAGARTTVASLWKVASRSTSTLMVDFHRELHARPTVPLAKAEALRRAKLKMLRGGEHRHPFHWAPFVLIGDPGTR